MYNREEDLQELRTVTLVLYALYAAALVSFGITLLVGGVIAFIKREEASGTPYYAHMEYLFRTLIGVVLGFVLSLIVSWFLNAFLSFIAFLAWGMVLVVGVWYVYRVGMGFYRFWYGQEISPTSWL